LHAIPPIAGIGNGFTEGRDCEPRILQRSRVGFQRSRPPGGNVYPTNDGYVAINVAVEEHWHHLLDAMGREDLRNDPRFKTNADRVAHIDKTDALVGTWTQTLSKMEVFTITKQHRIPCAPVRDVNEVMQDVHMHERGMLKWIDHDEIGRIVVPTSPLRFHVADRVATAPSPKLGQHNDDIYGGWLGLSQSEIIDLKQSGVI
jgi:crotonobetainyl-CoA:carnitine CoA-transferase CaiB-like acyl-CoA transferase